MNFIKEENRILKKSDLILNESIEYFRSKYNL